MKSDVWATGIIAYQAMSGLILFRSGNEEDNTIEKIIQRITNQVQGRLPTSYDRHVRSATWRML